MNRHLDVSTFIEFEYNFNLHRRKIQGVYIWDYIRKEVYNQINDELLEERTIKSEKENPLRSIFTQIKETLYRVWHSYKYQVTQNCDILFLGHPRRKKVGKYYWDIYCDAIINKIDDQCSYNYFETPFRGQHFHPSLTDNILYLDYLNIALKLLPYFKTKVIDHNEFKKIKYIEHLLFKNFNKNVDLKVIIRKYLNRYEFVQRSIRKLLDITNPRALIVVDSYNFIRKLFVEKANERNIPTIELQHGTVGKYHMGYNYYPGTEINSFPKYFFAWGKYWIMNTTFPVGTKVKVTGFPYFEKKLRESNNSKVQKSEKNILVISQWTVGFQIFNFINNLAEHISDYNIFYKLHPAEYSEKYNYKNRTISNNISIITDEYDLYDLFKTCKFQIGVYSTALIEGFEFGLKTFILPLPGHEIYSDLLNKEFIVVNEKNTFIDNLSDTRLKNQYSDHFFKKGSEYITTSEIFHIINQNF